jgi:Calcium-binding EGF domain
MLLSIWLYSRKGSCININECEKGYPNGCNRNADCIDMEGAYQCICKDGFTDADLDITGRNCTQTNECQLRTHNCDDTTQVCVDRRPPAKWECVERTPAPTPKPTTKPVIVTAPIPTPARTKTCRFNAFWGSEAPAIVTLLPSDCVCESTTKLGVGRSCYKIASLYYTIIPNEATCTTTGGTCVT